MLATVTTKGQVTIPKRVRDRLGIRPHDRVDFRLEGDRAVLVAVPTLKDLRGAVASQSDSAPEAERGTVKRSVASRTGREST